MRRKRMDWVRKKLYSRYFVLYHGQEILIYLDVLPPLGNVSIETYFEQNECYTYFSIHPHCYFFVNTISFFFVSSLAERLWVVSKSLSSHCEYICRSWIRLFLVRTRVMLFHSWLTRFMRLGSCYTLFFFLKTIFFLVFLHKRRNYFLRDGEISLRRCMWTNDERIKNTYK